MCQPVRCWPRRNGLASVASWNWLNVSETDMITVSLRATWPSRAGGAVGAAVAPPGALVAAGAAPPVPVPAGAAAVGVAAAAAGAPCAAACGADEPAVGAGAPALGLVGTATLWSLQAAASAAAAVAPRATNRRRLSFVSTFPLLRVGASYAPHRNQGARVSPARSATRAASRRPAEAATPSRSPPACERALPEPLRVRRAGGARGNRGQLRCDAAALLNGTSRGGHRAGAAALGAGLEPKSAPSQARRPTQPGDERRAADRRLLGLDHAPVVGDDRRLTWRLRPGASGCWRCTRRKRRPAHASCRRRALPGLFRAGTHGAVARLYARRVDTVTIRR